MLYSMFKKAEWGLFLLIFLIPQPNIWFKFLNFPLGSYYLNFIFLAVVFGLFIQNKGLVKNGNGKLILIFLLVSYIALWNSSMRFSLPYPVSFDNEMFKPWKNFAMMISMYFLGLSALRNEKNQKKAIVIMGAVLLIISIRSIESFTAGATFVQASRYGGPFETVGLGCNHLGAFIAEYAAFLLGLSFYETKAGKKLFYLAAVILSIHPLFVTYSRGAYVGALAALVFLGIAKKRSLIIFVVALVLFWQTMLPPSVVGRINMTETGEGNLDHASVVRLDLWNKAIDDFEQHPVFGLGFNGFQLSLQGAQFTDTHDYFLKILSEEGIAGAFLLLIVLSRAMLSGFRLVRTSGSRFHKGLGMGFLGCIAATIVTNLFGDRWSYIELGSYFWIIWGMVDGGLAMSQSQAVNEKLRAINGADQ